ncbi:MAG: penicillin acylase family protein [Actinomycetota bacterium]
MSDFVEQLREVASASLLPEAGELTAPGLSEPVEVLRDRWGVPYISAASLDDLWFAQGFVTAGERLFQMDLLLRAASGRLSEVFADRTLADDRFARTIGFTRTGAKLAAGWDDVSRAMHARFREGCAAWIARMPAPPVEYSLLDMSPDLPTDDAGTWAAAFAYLAWGLSGNWDKELLRAAIAERLGPEAVRTLLPPLPADPASIPAGALGGRLLDELPRPRGEGSNDWVLAGSRTSTGKPLLANDPHLLAVQPGAWIEMHLRAPGYEARGVALTFSPGILLGTTAHHSWGVTNVTGDVQDLYLEHLNDDRTAAEHAGAWEPLTIHREQIHVRGAAEPVVVEVRETRHGPIIETATMGDMHTEYIPLPSTETYALRWTGFECGIRPSLVLDAARATSFEEFRRATWGVECPGQNFVYADVDGTIGYQCTGRFPFRSAGDGTAPVPGWTGDHEWDGWIPFDELPWAIDPERGYLVTANDRIHDESYPHLIGHDFHAPHRASRVVERLEAVATHDVASMARIQLDTVSLPARDALRLLIALEPRSDEERDAIGLLAGWDGDMSADSVAAAVFNVWSRHIARRALEPGLGEELFRRYHIDREVFQCEVLPKWLRDPAGWLDDDLLRAALADALAELRERLGPDPTAWRWGALHRLRLIHPLGTIPGLGPLFTAADTELGGDEQTVMQGGFDGRDGYSVDVIASWRAVYDLADLDRSVGVLPAGVSGDPASPHWNDQFPLWIAGEHHALPFTRPAVEAAAVATFRLLPG